MVQDPIADFITRLKNAGSVGRESAVVPYSKLKLAIATVLEREGFVKAVTKKGKKVKKLIEVELLYNGKTPKIKGVERISHLGKRTYVKSAQVRSVKNGYGIALISTPKGILTDKEARKEHVGGEVLFNIW